MGGEIFADSEGAGRGTTVTFYLPLIRAEDGAGTPAEREASAQQLLSGRLDSQASLGSSAVVFVRAGGSAATSPPDLCPGEDAAAPAALPALPTLPSAARCASADGAMPGGRGSSTGSLAQPTPYSVRASSGGAFQSAAAAAGAPPEAAGSPPALLGRVLAAEDDRTSRIVLQKTLVKLGFDPLVVGDGQQALDAWRDDPGAFDMARERSTRAPTPLMSLRPPLPLPFSLASRCLTAAPLRTLS